MAMRRSTKMQLAKAAREARLPGRKMEVEYETWGDPEQRYGREPQQRYDRQPRNDWREPTRMGDYGPESRERGGDRSGGRMEYGGTRSNWDEDMEMRRGRRGGARSEWDDGMDMEGGREMESRFRDRRGREHYDDGRFAPMRSAYAPYGPYGEDEGPFGGGERGGDDMRQIGFNANWGNEMRMASDASIPRFNEMDRMPGNRAMMGGYMASERGHRKLDERTATEWVKGMKNEDGTKSPHWTMEQVKQVTKQKGLNLDPVEMFAILNALYSDYDPIFKKHGVSNMEFYVDMARAWIEDEDAVPNKAMAYYECIVK